MIYTGLKEFDNKFGGFYPGLYIISSRWKFEIKVVNSRLMTTIALSKRIPVYCYGSNYEVTADIHVTNISELYIEGLISHIENNVREGIVFIDDLDSITNNPDLSYNSNNSNIATQLSSIAKRLGITIVLNVIVPDTDDYPRLANLRAKDVIERDAEGIIFITNSTHVQESTKTLIHHAIIAKNIHGKVGSVKLVYEEKRNVKKRQLYITGDTHTLIDWDKINITNFPEQKSMTKEDILFIAGDAGIVWDEGDQDKYIQAEYNKRNFTTAYVDGNHENHDALDKYPVEMWHGGKVHRISDSIVHLMRGQVYRIDDKTIFTMGGAASTDKFLRKEGESWWAREMPSPEEYEEAINNLRKYNFKVDIVITHCAPEGFIDYKRSENDLTRFFDSLINEYHLQFTSWYCGHYHIDREYKNISILFDTIIDLTDLEIEIGYKDDDIFLLSGKEYNHYINEIPPLACGWWGISLRGKECWFAPWNGINNNGCEFKTDKYNAVRPAIKYKSIKSLIIKSPRNENRFYFNDCTFWIIDREREIAIAELPIAFDVFDKQNKDYEHSSIRRKLLEWFGTGVWENY